ncbi:NPCBM-associated, NEW3 domain of alpha-galactosidase [mine drainage metagenome]|uniref:NPCBM-associated, NEW3 domain of alpha-galactosidase n=1 Tax=mine drainage metagenome TaxID=410659 RepID=A0A1J5Q6T9_9ZZZZ
MASSQLAVELSAGATQSVSIGLENTGQSTATGLVADLTLPPGVSLAAGQQGAVIVGGGGRSVRFGTLTATAWTCGTNATDPPTVTCRLPELPGGQVTHLSVTLDVVKTAGGDGTVVLDIKGTGITPTHLLVPAHVATMPATLMVTGPPVQEVTAAEPHTLTWTVSNVGGQPATALSLALSVPDGLSLDPAGSSDSGWTCMPDQGPVTHGASSLTCSYPSLAPDGITSALTLIAIADTQVLAAEPPTLPIGYALTWTGSTSPSVGEADLTAVPSPGEMAVDAPSAATFVVGASTDVTFTVRHVSGPALRGIVVVVSPPAGVEWDGSAAPSGGWTCSDRADGTVGCARPTLEVGASVGLTLAFTATEAALREPTGELTATGFRDGTLAPSPTARVATTRRPVPAELTIAEVPSVRVVVGGTATVLVPWHNVGGTDAVDVLATVTLPLGVHGTVSIGTGGVDGTCTVTPATGPGPDVWTCTVPSAAAGADGVITLALTADQSARGATGLGVSIDLTATGAVPAATGTIPVTVSSPVLGFGTPAPLAALSAGRSGTIAFTVTNTGDALANNVVAQVDLPAGVELDAGLVGAASCSTSGGTTPTVTCALGSLAAGANAPLVIGLTARTAGVSELLLTIRADGLEPVEQNLEARIADAGLSPRYTSSTGSDVTEIGAPLLTCTESAACTDILDGTSSGNNNSLAMVPLNVADGTQTSSSSTLTIPEGRKVTFAGLYWSADAGPAQTFDTAALGVAHLRGPGDTTYRDITGAVVSQVTDDAGRSYYQSFADVTSQVAAGGSGTWSVADVALPTGRVDSSPTYYAGWALVVVYSGGTGDVTVYDGGAWVASNSSVPFAFQGAKGQAVRLGVVAWEGDQATAGDTLSLNGSGMTPLRWDPSHRTLHPGSTTNAFDSTAVGSAYVNSLGVDAKGFASGSLVAGVNTVVASTSGDQYLIGVLTVTTAGEG